MANESIFTKIINREVPAEIIHETDKVIAFLDIHPIRPGHTLVVPKTEVDEWQDLDRETYREVMEAAYDIAHLLKQKLNPPRVGMVIQGFDVPHAHVQVTPLHEATDVVSTTRDPDFMSQEPDYEALRAMRETLVA
ncbi:HIT family protein [Candidatus Saccharibacteria bacterium QS_5_54_17]|nr:MAG: HIT family protein [Candidatus Saccharibacteria bacterium QS_5_54_17]